MNPADPRAVRTRAAILDAAVRVLSDVGISAATMDGVAAAAGVSRSTLYRHFPTYAELLFAALERIAPAPPPPDGDPIDQVESAVLGLAGALREGPWGAMVGSILERAERDAEVRRYHAAFTAARRAPLVTALRALLEDGAPDHGEPTDPESVATALVAPLYYRHLVLHDPMDDAETVRHVRSTLAALRSSIASAPADC